MLRRVVRLLEAPLVFVCPLTRARMISAMRRSLTCTILAVIAGCDVLGPPQRNQFHLQSINGLAVPTALYSGVRDGREFEFRLITGSLTLYSNGRFLWATVGQVFLDGAPELPIDFQRRRLTGFYERTDTSLTLPSLFVARAIGDPDVLALQDISGAHEWKILEVGRK